MKNFGLVNTLVLILFVFSLLYPYLLLSLGGHLAPTWSYWVSLSLGILYVLIVLLGSKSFDDKEELSSSEDIVLSEVNKGDQNEEEESESLKDLSALLEQVITKDYSSENKESEFASGLMSVLAKVFEIGQGAMYFSEQLDDKKVLVFKGGYAYHKVEEGVYIDFGEGLTGQVAKAQKSIKLDVVPEGYITIFSGLGESTPSHLYIYPLVVDGTTLAVIEMASFNEINEAYIKIFEEELDRISKHISENF